MYPMGMVPPGSAMASPFYGNGMMPPPTASGWGMGAYMSPLAMAGASVLDTKSVAHRRKPSKGRRKGRAKEGDTKLFGNDGPTVILRNPRKNKKPGSKVSRVVGGTRR